MTYAIEAHGLSKQYRLGVSGTGWLVRDIERWIRRLVSREQSEEESEEYFWAL